jgi:cellulose synthase/poly-beta-1,6-N-acetylglucosamine synthase-like glycosyltransferase
LYSYGLYPLILRMMPRYVPAQAEPIELPYVSIVVPAYNEEAQIRGAVDALIAQDYPANRRQILILSDASTDDTDNIVRSYESQGVELLRMPVRGGKTAAENASCRLLRGEIIVNTDASIRLHHSCVTRLVQAMADPTVGVASSSDVSITRDTSTANLAEAGYVGYEMRIRALETRTGGIVGASGSGYAIRNQLHRLPVREDLSRDFSAALTARRHGFRAVSVNDAFCYVPRTSSLHAEYRRKVRTIARGMETLLYNRVLLDPKEHGAFAWKLFSHKVCRWAVPVSAVFGLIGLIILCPYSALAAVALGGAAVAMLIATAGWFWPASRALPRPISVISFAAAANVAVLHALFRVLHGHEDHVWEPTRRSTA